MIRVFAAHRARQRPGPGSALHFEGVNPGQGLPQLRAQTRPGLGVALIAQESTRNRLSGQAIHREKGGAQLLRSRIAPMDPGNGNALGCRRFQELEFQAHTPLGDAPRRILAQDQLKGRSPLLALDLNVCRPKKPGGPAGQAPKPLDPNPIRGKPLLRRDEGLEFRAHGLGRKPPIRFLLAGKRNAGRLGAVV